MAPGMWLRLPEPGSFEDLLRPVRIEVASLVRLSRHPATEPYWSAGVYRFDDPEPGRAGAFGTCYTASSIEVAFAESVIHESGRFVGGSCEVPAAELTERSVVRFACPRRKTLVLADLTGAALKSPGLNNDISSSADYAASQAWAQAIHDAAPRWDGIRYVSRQMNKGIAYAIFGRSGLLKLRAEKLKARQVDDLCDRLNVTAVYGRRPLGPTDRYELWIKRPDGVERKFTVNTRHMPARRGHVVSLIVTAHHVPQVLALANWSTIDGVNYARTDAPSLIRTWDFIVLPSAFLAMGVRFGDVGMIAFVPAAAMYLAAMVAGRAAYRARLAWQVDRAIDLEAWRTSATKSTQH